MDEERLDRHVAQAVVIVKSIEMEFVDKNIPVDTGCLAMCALLSKIFAVKGKEYKKETLEIIDSLEKAINEYIEP